MLKAESIKQSNTLFMFRPVLFILDAYDELPSAINLITKNKIFRKFPNSKVIISSRIYNILSISNYKRFFYDLKID